MDVLWTNNGRFATVRFDVESLNIISSRGETSNVSADFDSTGRHCPEHFRINNHKESELGQRQGAK